jgi:hypothetical protein
LAGGLWLAPLVYLEHARFGPGWYGKVVSSDPERLLAWAVSKAIPRRALEVKSLPDVDMPRKGRRRLPGYHIDLWGARLALAYDPQTLAAARRRSVALGGRLSTRAPAIAAAEVGSISSPNDAACRQARSMASSATAIQRPPL